MKHIALNRFVSKRSLGTLLSLFAVQILSLCPCYAGFHTVDLSRFYNKLADSFEYPKCWAVAPWGQQVWEGVPFQLGGIMEMTGLGSARIDLVFAGRQVGIPVQATGEWIHVIHCAGFKEDDGVPMIRLRLNYENGQRCDFPLRYGDHSLNWWVAPNEGVTRLSDPYSKEIWTHANPESPVLYPTLRLFKSSLRNPYPGCAIKTVDATGHAVVEFPTTRLMQIILQARSPGYAVSQRIVSIEDMPKELTVELETGITIGGLVCNPAGRPIAGAKIIISVPTKDEVGQTVLQELETVITGPDGAWKCSLAPSNVPGLNFILTHPKFIPVEYHEAKPIDNLEHSVTSDELRSGKAVFTMTPVILLVGTVSMNRDNPLLTPRFN